MPDRACRNCKTALVLGENWSASSLRDRCYECKPCYAARKRSPEGKPFSGREQNPNCLGCGASLVRGENWTDGQYRSYSKHCAACNASNGRSWYAANKERAAASRRSRNATDPEKPAAARRRWAAGNTEKRDEYTKKASAKLKLGFLEEITQPRGAQTAEHVAKRRASLEATLASTVRQCVECKNDFRPTTGPQKYCSGQCWNAAFRRGRDKRHKIQVSPTAYRALSKKFGLQCGICGAESGSFGRNNRLAVDHCHDTGHIRGLLCSRCNTAIGLMCDDTDRLANAIEYLKRAVAARAELSSG